MIYLDNAATTLRKPPQVIDAMVSAMGSFGNSARGTHEEALAASRVIYDTRCKLAALFGCKRPDHVAFTCNSTEALNIAIHGCIHAGEHVISTDLEHNSVLRPLYRLERENNVKLSFVPADRQGNIDYADFERLLRPDTRAVVCTHASNLTGNTLDLACIGAFAHEHDLLFIVDASQSAGVLPIDMEQMHIDVLCFTGHKSLMGPQGTGGLCVREGVDINPWKVGGTGVQTYLHEQPEQMPTRLEAGTLNGHGIAGLNAALDFLQETGIGTIHAHETALLRRFVAGVKKIPGVALYGDFDHERTAVAALNIGDMEFHYFSSYVVDSNDIDVNQHMNNTVYMKIAQSSCILHPISTFEIDFEKECYLNETIALESYSDSNDYYVVGRKNDGILSFIVKFSSKENF